MIELASDDFNRADADPISGGNWVKPVAGDDHFKILTNVATFENVNNDADEMYDGGITWPDNQYSQADMIGTGGGGDDQGPGVIVRASTAPAYYRIIASMSTGDVTVCKFNPTKTQLGALITSTFVEDDILRVEVSGSTIEVFRNGISLGTRTDSAITSGKPGIFYSSIGGVDNAVDNWSGGGDAAAAVGVSNRYLVRHSRMTSW